MPYKTGLVTRHDTVILQRPVFETREEAEAYAHRALMRTVATHSNACMPCPYVKVHIEDTPQLPTFRWNFRRSEMQAMMQNWPQDEEPL